MLRTTHKLYALNAATGQLLWDTATRSEALPSSPLVAGGLIVIAHVDSVRALDAETGQEVWVSHDKGCQSPYPAAFGPELVYVVQPQCGVVAYDRATGALVWEADLPCSRCAVDLFLDQDRIYILGGSETLQVLDATTGVLLEEVSGAVGVFSTYQSGVIYGFNRLDEVVAFDTHKSKVLWRSIRTIDAQHAPVVAKRYVIVPPYNGVPIALSNWRGKTIWEADIENDTYMSPVVLNNVVYIRGMWSGRIYALALQGGVELGHLETGKVWLSSNYAPVLQPVLADGMLIVPVGRMVYGYN